VRTVDEADVCFGCAVVQHFTIIIEKQTDIAAGDEAVDLACELAERARRLIVAARDNGEANDFLQTSASEWSGTSKDH
jgi:hypothetical protein